MELTQRCSGKSLMSNGGNAGQMLRCMKNSRMKLAGHCHRHPELAASDLFLWQPNQNLRRERPKVDFVEVLRKDAGNLTTELCTVMEDRTVWRNHVTPRLQATK